jgi:hypothetical protein
MSVQPIREDVKENANLAVYAVFGPVATTFPDRRRNSRIHDRHE